MRSVGFERLPAVLFLLNTTKLMNLAATTPLRLKATTPQFMNEAKELAFDLRTHDAGQLAKLMALNADLARRTRADYALWGDSGRQQTPALFTFMGLVYKHLDAAGFDAATRRRAQQKLRIISGLYGLLKPFDLIEAYRLEVGCKYQPLGSKNLVAYWRDKVTDALNADLRDGEPVISTASQEYLRVIDIDRLRGPVITPVFKERHSGGKLKTPVVHAKMARGALIRDALKTGVKHPRDLMGWSDMGWEAAEEVPQSGPWLFTRNPR